MINGQNIEQTNEWTKYRNGKCRKRKRRMDEKSKKKLQKNMLNPSKNEYIVIILKTRFK